MVSAARERRVPVRRCRPVQALSGNECAGFAFDRNVFECMMLPTAFNDRPWEDSGFRRPPVAAIFRAARGGVHCVAEQLGLIAVVNVHLKAVENNDYGPVRRNLARRLLRPSYCHTHVCVHFCPSSQIWRRNSSSRALLRPPRLRLPRSLHGGGPRRRKMSSTASTVR